MSTHSLGRSRISAFLAVMLASLFALAFTTQAASAAPIVNPGPVDIALTGGQLAIGDGELIPPVNLEDLGEASLGGVVAADGSITIPKENVDFPDMPIEDDDFDLLATILAPSDGTGQIDPLTGEATLNIALRIEVRGTAKASGITVNLPANGSCAIDPIVLDLTTGTTTWTGAGDPPEGWEPMTGVPYNMEDGTASVVNNTLSVQKIPSGACGKVLFFIDVAGILNDQVGLPFTAGESFAELDVKFDPVLIAGIDSKFTVDTTAGQIPLPVNFDASASEVYVGELQLCDEEVTEDCGYQWDWNGDGTIDEVTATPTAAHTYNITGNITPQLTLCNDEGLCVTGSGETLVISNMELEFTGQPPALSNNTSATFEFTSNPAADSYECNLDETAWEACASPVTFEELSDGTHSLKLRGVLDGQTSQPITSAEWTIDTVKPVVTIAGTSPENTSSATEGTVSWSVSSDNEPVTFECSYDGAEFAACDSGVEVEWDAEAGSHTFTVNATDALGNTDSVTHEWRFVVQELSVEWTSPLVSETAWLNNDALNGAFTWEASGTAAGIDVSSQCQKNDAAWVDCNSGSTGSGNFTANAVNTFSVRAIDTIGNVSGEITQTFHYDNAAPGQANISSPTNNEKVNTNTPDFVWSGPDQDDGSPFVSQQECRIQSEVDWTDCESPWTSPVALPSKEGRTASQRRYTMQVRTADEAGNVTSPSGSGTRNFEVDAPPLMDITGGPAEGGVSDPDVTFTFTADRVSGSSFECDLDGAGYEPCSSPVSYEGLSGGEHSFAVRGTRNVGTGEPATRNWEVDPYERPFAVTFNHGIGTFGAYENVVLVTPSNTSSFTGIYNRSTGDVSIAPEDAVLPTRALELPGGVTGSLSLHVRGNGLAGSWNPDSGHLMLRGPLEATAEISSEDGDLTCTARTNVRYSTDRTEPWEGQRFAQGLEGEGAVVGTWTIDSLNGDEGCDELTPLIAGDGAMWLGHDIEAPPGPPVVVEMAEVSGPTLVNSSNVQVGSINPGKSLTCNAGVWENYSQLTFAWFRDGVEFDNNKPNGTGQSKYRAQASDAGSDITCAQTARASGSTTWVMGSQSNATTVAGTQFALEFTDGMVSFGDYTDLVIAEDVPVIGPERSVKIAGTIGDGGSLSIPADGVEFPTTEFDLGEGAGMGLTGTVTFSADSGLTGNWNAVNGHLTIKGSLTATVGMESPEGSATCHTTTSVRFSTDRTVPYQGQRFTAGLAGAGTIVDAWTNIPGLTGDAGCSDLDPFVQGPGGMTLSAN